MRVNQRLRSHKHLFNLEPLRIKKEDIPFYFFIFLLFLQQIFRVGFLISSKFAQERASFINRLLLNQQISGVLSRSPFAFRLFAA